MIERALLLLERMVAALEKIAAVPVAAPATAVAAVVATPTETPKPVAPKAKKEKPAPAPAPEAPAPEAAPKAFKLEEVRAALIARVEKDQAAVESLEAKAAAAEKIKGYLVTFGKATKLSEVKPENYAALMAALSDVAEAPKADPFGE